jgi:hypothetical protein
MRTFVLISVGFVVAVLLVLGCPKKQETPAPLQQPPPTAPRLVDPPIEMTVKQRTTTSVPGSDQALSITIDDVTRGQVMISLAGKDGNVVLGPTSLAEGQSAKFKLGEKPYSVTLSELDNELVGEDTARLVFSDTLPADASLTDDSASRDASTDDAVSEHAKIEQLIDHVAALQNATFIRNGEEHTPAEAAEHLRRKWEAAGDEITTVEDFIEKIASKSSTTDEPYRIRFDRGETDAGIWLRNRLNLMHHDEEAAKAADDDKGQ